MARPSRRPGEEAVSPVVSTILAVAITVVLAASVFVVSGRIGARTADEVPPILLRRDEANDHLDLVRGGDGSTWGRLRVEAPGAAATVRFELNGAATQASTAVAPTATLPDDPIRAGDFVALCADSELDAQRIQLVHTSLNSVLFQDVFLRLHPCPP